MSWLGYLQEILVNWGIANYTSKDLLLDMFWWPYLWKRFIRHITFSFPRDHRQFSGLVARLQQHCLLPPPIQQSCSHHMLLSTMWAPAGSTQTHSYQPYSFSSNQMDLLLAANSHSLPEQLVAIWATMCWMLSRMEQCSPLLGLRTANQPCPIVSLLLVAYDL